jgi:hypothetical protein
LEHLFLIRAVDNLGKQDPSPDTLRFEAFTSANPNVWYVDSLFVVENPRVGTLIGMDPGDTVDVFSSVTFVWSGNDPDGDPGVVAWESKFDQELTWRSHGSRLDTTRIETNIQPGPHTMSVRAIDDAGAKSTQSARFPFTCNFDPVSQITRTSVRGTLPRPWLHPDSILVSVLDDGMGGIQDTMPLGCTMEMCWTATDVDGPIAAYQWKIDQLGGQTSGTCVNTSGLADSTLDDSSLDNTLGVVLTVKGIDIYDNVETRPETLRVHVNFRPTVKLTTLDGVPIPEPGIGDTTTVTVAVGPHRFEFDGGDRDGDPNLLRYRWQFSFDPSASGPTDTLSGYLDQEFDPTHVRPAPHVLWIEAQDSGGPSRPSYRDVVKIQVVP